ncbi:MAG: peptidylprolyl isomerase [Rhodospirillales bacterium]|nr:peptidylprolyl isomerase [Rhodospirillales bacterium]
MKPFFLAAFLLCVPLLAIPHAAWADREGIAATVNEDAITTSDVEDRMKLMVVSSGLPDTEEMRTKLRMQVVNMLVDERLRMQEAGRAGVTVTPEDIAEGFAAIAKQNNIPTDDFRKMMVSKGIPVATLERQIESQIAWSQAVQKTLRPKILLSDVDIDDRIRRMESAIGKTEYLLAEIFLPVENRKQDGEKKALANRLVAEIRERGAPFPAVARQFSQSAGAAQGGNLGWVPEDQLDPAIAKALKSADKGKMTAPVRVADGYHIVLLRDTRTITKESIPSREQVMNMIGTEALERLARRKLRDLRDSAFIDTRA